MKEIIDLKDLLKHEILDLYSTEDQIIDSLPDMIENATKPELKQVLSNHLEVSRVHKVRLDAIKKELGQETEEDNGFFSNLFGGSNSVTSKGVEGLIKDAGKLMDEEMTPQARDAAIIGAAQKIEHYEIAAYGTAHAYAVELSLDSIASELKKTLQDEYDADDALTKLAVGRINMDAENAVSSDIPDNADDDYQRLTNSVSIMKSSEPDDYQE